jgi:hypothetical protein
MKKTSLVIAVSIALLSLAMPLAAAEKGKAKPMAKENGDRPPDMTFFISSVGSGKGADFGGLAGADRHCQNLAQAAGAGKHTWRAYLSTTGSGSVNARDRIGKGPWHSAEGRLIARDVEELHGNNNINRMVALSEKGARVANSTSPPNQHDILTGSQPDGRAASGSGDTTCNNWTSGDKGSAIVGHHDRLGLLADPDANRSWNSSHGSKGCSHPALVSTSGAGLIYCFAADTGGGGSEPKKMTKKK